MLEATILALAGVDDLPSPAPARPRLAWRPRRALGDAADSLISLGAGQAGLSAEQAQAVASLWKGVRDGTVSSGNVDSVAQQVASVAMSKLPGILAQAQKDPSGAAWSSAASMASAAATAAFVATPLAPVAPIAGMIAGGMVEALRPRPVPAWNASTQLAFWTDAFSGSCSDGACRSEIRALLKPTIDRVAYLKGLDCSVKSSWFGLKHEGPDNPDCDWDTGWAFDQGINEAKPKIALALARSRLRYEVAFLEKVKTAARALENTYLSQCQSASCSTSVSATAWEAAYQTAIAARRGDPGASAQADNAIRQLESVVQASREAQALKLGLYSQQLALVKQRQAEDAQRRDDARAALASAQVAYVAARGNAARNQKILLGVVALGALAVVVAAALPKRRS